MPSENPKQVEIAVRKIFVIRRISRAHSPNSKLSISRIAARPSPSDSGTKNPTIEQTDTAMPPSIQSDRPDFAAQPETPI